MADDHFLVQTMDNSTFFWSQKIPSGLFSPIIARCLAKDPAVRYESPQELLEDLSRICSANKIFLPSKPEPMGSLFLYPRARSLWVLGKTNEALAVGEKLVALEADPDNWNLLGAILLDKGRNREAIDAFDRALALDKTRSLFWKNLGLAYQRLGVVETARDAFERAEACEE